jgi:hypothetical protein
MTTPSAQRLRTAETNIATNTTNIAAVVALQTVDVTLQITTTELTDSDGQQTFDFAAALPADAFVIGCWVEVTATVTDGAAGTATCDVGIKDGNTDGFLDAADLTTATGNINIPRGALATGMFGGETPTVIVDGSVDLDTMTTGNFTVHVLYQVVTTA